MLYYRIMSKKSNRSGPAVAIAVTIILAGCGAVSAMPSTAPTAPATVAQGSAPPLPSVTPLAPSGHVGPPGAYPDPVRTPGVLDPRVTQSDIKQTICVSGYTKTVRPSVGYTDALKVSQIKLYGFTDVKLKDYEEDHFIPLELGGSPTDPKNLWPEAYAPVPGSHQKDTVETYLKDRVCSGAMTLLAAQAAIQTDWVAAYHQETGR